MANEYDQFNEPATSDISLKDALYNILNSFQDKEKLRETGEGLTRLRQSLPGVAESVGRGAIAAVPGVVGDLSEFGRTWAPEVMEKKFGKERFFPTTREILDYVPRMTPTHEGASTLEDVASLISPGIGGVSKDVAMLTKGKPIGLSMIGPESKLWKDATEGLSLENQAFKASKLEAKGKTADEILKETGMVRGLDNQWRSEITDFWSTIKGNKPFGELYKEKALTNPNVKVKDILDHPELFRHYPELGELDIRPHPKTEPYKGQYHEGDKYITLNEDLSPEEARSVLHHELTHGTQAIENWNRGGNVSTMDTWSKIEANKRMAALKPELDAVWNEISERRKAGLPYDDLQAKKIELIDQQNKAFEFGMQDPHKLYEQLGGEAEARMVQRRLGLTQDQLREHFPYAEGPQGLDINPDEALIAGYEPGVINGPSMSQPKASVEVKSIPQSEIDELGFHSPLENAILKIQQPKGTGEQFLKQLEKTPGVKTEELDVTGVKQYLLDHPNVTKQELLDHMKNSRLKLENKVLGEATGETAEDYQLQGGDVYHDQDYIDATAEDLHYQLSNDADIYHQEQEALVDRFPELYKGHENEPDVAARLNQHVEENIKELADTQAREMYYENPIRHYYDEHGYDVYGNDEMGYSVKDPQGRFLDIGGRNGIYDINDAESSLRQHHLDEGNINYEGDGAKYEDYTLPGKYTNYREVLTTHQPTPAIVKELPNGAWTAQDAPNSPSNIGFTREDAIRAWRNEQKNYESSHYDEPNILAHTRLNDRTINGKKTLMVEEIQSDWHQAGRRKGYDTGISKPQYTIETDPNGVFRVKDINNERFEPIVDGDRLSGFMTKEAAENAVQANINRLPKKRGGGEVPDAPFKKNWHELMMKQILNEAVKGDYDAIAFTTGRQQVERYENQLRQAVDKIEFSKGYPPGTITIQGVKNGRNSFEGTVENGKFIDGPGKGKTIEEVLGKGLAKQIEDHPGGELGVIQGKDLTIGGEGMKGFYDKILPDFVNKYGKKYGISTKKANLPGERLPSQEAVNDYLKSINMPKQEFDKLSIDERAKILDDASPKGEEVHYFDLSDMAKKDIKEKGQPLFSGIGLAAPALMPEDQDKTKK